MKTLTDKILHKIEEKNKLNEKGPVATQRSSSKAEKLLLEELKRLQAKLQPGIWKGNQK